MKHVIFLGYDEPRGLTYHFVDWVKALDRFVNAEIGITFVTLLKEQLPGLHSKLGELRFVDVRIVDSSSNLSKVARFQDVDIVHCHTPRQLSAIFRIRRRMRTDYKVVATIHAFKNGSWYKHIYANLLSLLFLNKADIIHFLSHKSKEEFLAHNRLYSRHNRSFVFPLGCNCSEFAEVHSINELGFYDELVAGSRNIVYIADFHPFKQHLWLVETIGDILIRNGATLWLLGGGPGVKRVNDYIRKHRLNDFVKLPGRVDRQLIPTILKRMHIAVCVSKSENSPHSIMEPMFAGLPVVAFDVGTAGLLIQDFYNGFVIRDKTESKNFRNAISFLIENTDKASEMGKAGQLRAERWLTWETVAKNTISMYYAT